MLAEIACLVLLSVVAVLAGLLVRTKRALKSSEDTRFRVVDQLWGKSRENEALTERIEELAIVADRYDELRIDLACLDEDHGADLVDEDDEDE